MRLCRYILSLFGLFLDNHFPSFSFLTLQCKIKLRRGLKVVSMSFFDCTYAYVPNDTAYGKCEMLPVISSSNFAFFCAKFDRKLKVAMSLECIRTHF